MINILKVSISREVHGDIPALIGEVLKRSRSN
jgi:hypothetical protein